MSETYYLNLKETPFNLIKEDRKSIEMRLCNKGRDKIKANDFIVFTNEISGEKIKTIVISVSKFSSFSELYAHFDKKLLGYLDNETANPDDMLIYYKKEDIERFGVLAIKIKLV